MSYEDPSQVYRRYPQYRVGNQQYATSQYPPHSQHHPTVDPFAYSVQGSYDPGMDENSWPQDQYVQRSSAQYYNQASYQQSHSTTAALGAHSGWNMNVAYGQGDAAALMYRQDSVYSQGSQGARPAVGTGASGYPRTYQTDLGIDTSWDPTDYNVPEYQQDHQTSRSGGQDALYYSQTGPQLKIDPPDDSESDFPEYGYTHRSYDDDAAAAASTAQSPSLSPFTLPYRTAHQDEDSGSDNSNTPQPSISSAATGSTGCSGGSGGDPTRRWSCKQAECAGKRPFKRHADLMRHMSTVHHREGMDDKFDCPRRGCPRKGDNGFTRKDHLTEHLRNFHVQDIPKRRGSRSGR